MTEYTIDRNREFSEVIQENDTIHVYGDTLLQSNNTNIISGFNDRVVAKIDSDKTSKIVYNDYGSTSNINAGHGYNGDMLDRTGLIYLRARYYDPSVSRFIQIDNNYDGEQKSVSSQNRYVYTLNNPYKYVDRNGNSSIAKTVSDAMKKALRNAGNAITNASKKAKSAMDTWVSNAMEITKNALKTGANAVVGASSNNKSGNGGGTSKAKPKVKKVSAQAKCPEKDKTSTTDNMLNTLQDVLDWIGWLPGIGDICDGINAVISFLRKAYLAAAISVACLALPVVADAIFKPIKKLVTSASGFATKAIEGLSKAGHKPSKIISGITSFCNGVKGFIKDCWLIPGKIKTKVAGWIDSAKDYVKELFEKAKSNFDEALSPKYATNTGADIGSSAGKETAQEIADRVQKEAVEGGVKKTTKELTEIASKLGFKKTNILSSEQAVFENGKKYITYDIDSHNGGFWKMADSVKNLGKKQTRMGTYDINLKRIGD